MSQDDQLVLIKGGFFELWLIGASRLISSTDNTVTFGDGSYFSKHQFELLFNEEFSSSVFEFAASINHLGLNDTEIALYSAVVLLSPERPGILDQKEVHQLQEKIVELLKVQLNKTHPTEDQLLTHLAVKLPELRQIGQRNHEHLNWFRSNYKRVRVPPLFSEIYDIPKFDDDRL